VNQERVGGRTKPDVWGIKGMTGRKVKEKKTRRAVENERRKSEERKGEENNGGQESAGTLN
jgi:hypothetical protein